MISLLIQSYQKLKKLHQKLHKIGQLVGNVLKPLAKSFLIPIGLTPAASTTDAAIYNKMFGSGTTTISNEEISDIMKIVKSLEESSLLITGVKQLKMKQKNKKDGF